MIKNIIEMIINFFRNLFGLNKKKSKINKNRVVEEEKEIEKKKKSININLQDEEHISSLYFKLIEDNILYKQAKLEDLVRLKNKINMLKQGVGEEELKLLNEIDKKITYEPLNNIDVIKIDEVIKKTEKHDPPYNKEEKIRKINNDIKDVLNEKLTKTEKNAIEKAYSKYDKVDYVIMTTVLIDDLKNRLDKAKEDYSLNKISIQEYRNRIKSIKESIEELGNINNKPYVREEIKRLREDIYTKKNDKYDILFNDNLFYELEKECEHLEKKTIKKEIEVEIDERVETEKKKKEEQKKIEEKKKREEEKLILKKKRKELEEQSLIVKLMQYYNEIYTNTLGGEKNINNKKDNKVEARMLIKGIIGDVESKSLDLPEDPIQREMAEKAMYVDAKNKIDKVNAQYKGQIREPKRDLKGTVGSTKVGYENSLNEAKNAGHITEQEYNREIQRLHPPVEEKNKSRTKKKDQ